jgi:hypothetical protein
MNAAFGTEERATGFNYVGALWCCFSSPACCFCLALLPSSGAQVINAYAFPASAVCPIRCRLSGFGVLAYRRRHQRRDVHGYLSVPALTLGQD